MISIPRAVLITIAVGFLFVGLTLGFLAGVGMDPGPGGSERIR